MIQRLKALLLDSMFREKHKRRRADFTRERKLQFEDIVVLLLQKGIKSLQLRINEFLGQMIGRNIFSMSGSAFCKARKKLQHTVFQALNAQVVVPTFYEGTYNVWEDMRILAVDGSKVRLPFTEDIKKEFGIKRNQNTVRQLHLYCMT